MTYSTYSLLALLPILATAQLSDTVTGLGGLPTDENALLYYRASKNPTAHSAVAITGYNWTIPLTFEETSGSTNSSDTWEFNFDYANITLPNNDTTGITFYSMEFPDGPWSNTSDFQLCTSIVMDDFPTSISSKSGGSNNQSCVPYLGQSCVDALAVAYATAYVDPTLGCPTLPSFSSIDACKSVADAMKSESIGSAAITNTTASDVIYYRGNSSYLNVATGQTYNDSTVSRPGLSSGKVFAYQQLLFPSSAPATASQTEAQKLRMIGLAIAPTLNFRNNSTGGWVYEENVRLVCGRADTTSGASRASAAFSIRGVPFALLSAAFAAVTVTMFW